MPALRRLKVGDGVGKLHINRFRVYFEAPYGKKVPELGAAFQSGFVGFFNGGTNPASLSINGGVFKFTFGYDGETPNNRLILPHIHDDWVEIGASTSSEYCAGFCAHTMERLDEDETDQRERQLIDSTMRPALRAAELAAKLATFLPGGAILAPIVLTGLADKIIDAVIKVVSDFFINVNKQHFLSGTRSWMIVDATNIPGAPKRDKGKKTAPAVVEQTNKYRYRPIYFLETAAIEKSSNRVYQGQELGPRVGVALFDALGTVGSVIWNIPGVRSTILGIIQENIDACGLNLRLDIINIWTGLLQNYISRTGYVCAFPPFDDGVGWEGARGFVKYVAEGPAGDVTPIHEGLKDP